MKIAFSSDRWQKRSKQRWRASNPGLKFSYYNNHGGVQGINYAEIILETKYLY